MLTPLLSTRYLSATLLHILMGLIGIKFSLVRMTLAISAGRSMTTIKM